MHTILNTPLFTVFATVLIIESLKSLFLGTATALGRAKVQKFLNQEDADWLGGEAITVDHPDPARLMRAHRNNLENLLPFFIGGILYLLSGANTLAGIGYVFAFFVGRSAHTYAYLSRRAMLRRNMYSLAWLAMIAMLIHALFVIAQSGY